MILRLFLAILLWTFVGLPLVGVLFAIPILGWIAGIYILVSGIPMTLVWVFGGDPP